MILPQKRREPRAEALSPRFEQEAFIKSRILVVDDDRMLAESLGGLLRLQGYPVQVAFCGKSAIQMAAQFDPETLIIDIVMPCTNGLETATHVRALLPSCKIILITGRSAAADLVLKTHALADGFELLAKPVHPSDLLRRL